jgi:hypothetical protein
MLMFIYNKKCDQYPAKIKTKTLKLIVLVFIENWYEYESLNNVPIF